MRVCNMNPWKSNIVACVLLVVFAACDTLAEKNVTFIQDHFGGDDMDAYMDWYISGESGVHYTHTLYMPSREAPEQGVAVHWSIQEETNSINLAVATRGDSGWLGFGLAETGGMRGADAVLFQTANPSVLVDAHILEERLPITDDCQDWTLKHSKVDGGFIIFEGQRYLDTGDSQDTTIVNDTHTEVRAHRIIAAWGETSDVTYHGPNNRVRSSVRFFRDAELDDTALFLQRMEADAEGYFDVKSIDYSIKTGTEYVDFCANRADLVGQGVPVDKPLHIIGYLPLVDSDTDPYVHHFTVYGSQQPNEPTQANNETCDFADGLFYEMVYVWTPGTGPMTLPGDVGAPLGGSEDPNAFQSFKLEIHYNNPSLVSDLVDTSGVRFYYTSQLRAQELGVLQLGDPYLGLYGVQLPQGLSQHSFACNNPDCSSDNIGDEPITVLAESLHMHASGEKMVNEQIRDGQVVRRAVVEFYDFDQDGGPIVQQETYEVKAGDTWNTVCYFRGENQIFGLGSEDEMCIAFLFYYPRKYSPVNGTAIPYFCGYGFEFNANCLPEYHNVSLTDDAELERSFGATSPQCRAPYQDMAVDVDGGGMTESINTGADGDETVGDTTADADTPADETSMGTEAPEDATNDTSTASASSAPIGLGMYLVYVIGALLL